MMLEAEQIRRLLDVADPIVRAQILLGVNCGFGDGDCAKLPITALDLDGGWVDFPRPKTGVDRRCPLWPETVKAIRRAVEVRKPPKRSGLEHLAFLTKFGASWIGYMDKAKMTRYFPTLARKAGVTLKDGQGFYALRRTFETIGGDTGDQVAVDYLMGHAPTSGDMAAVYRQRFEDHRLIAVTEHVRRWLCPDKSQAQIDADSRRRQLAGEINVEWEKIERLAGKDVKTALNKLHISQTDLAKAVGYSLDWVNTKICGRVDRHGKEGISAEADFRFRAYISQLAEGIDPQPLAGEELMPRYEGPHDFPLSDEAVSALKRHPFTAVELRVVVVCLKESGVKQETLAEWWSYSHKFFREMLCRRKSIPYNAANRLRQLFRVPTVEIELGEPRKLVLGRLPITPEVRAALDSTQFGLADATKVLEYLRSIGILKAELCRFLGLHYTRYFSNAGCGRSSLLQPRLRSLFAFGEEGGAQ